MLPQRSVGDARGYPQDRELFTDSVDMPRLAASDGPEAVAGPIGSRAYRWRRMMPLPGGTVLAQRQTGAPSCRRTTSGLARLDDDATRDRVLGGGAVADRAAARARQADRARAARAAARRRIRSSSSTRSSRHAAPIRTIRSAILGDGVVTGHGTIDGRLSSSSARTSRSSAARCPRRTPRRSARSWISR